jgi:sugar phosphate isomerase/epimerase
MNSSFILHSFAPLRTGSLSFKTLSRRELLRRGALTAAAIACAQAEGGARSAAPDKETTRMMHLGIVTYNVAKDWDLDTILKICREAGIEGVEFRTTHRHGVEPALSAAQRKEVRQKCADAGLLQTSLGSVCEFHSPDPALVKQNIETCREFILLAKDIGARGVKVRPNGLPKEVPTEKTLEQIGKALAECGRVGAENGVEIWMEVHGSGTMLPPNARKIMDACGHRNVGVTWNSNATDVVNGSVKESFDLLRPFIRCCHITELWSDYPYRELFGLLQQTGYDRFTLCEIGSSIQPEDGVPFLRCYKGLWKELGR